LEGFSVNLNLWEITNSSLVLGFRPNLWGVNFLKKLPKFDILIILELDWIFTILIKALRRLMLCSEEM
jgi:hypothetical protein